MDMESFLHPWEFDSLEILFNLILKHPFFGRLYEEFDESAQLAINRVPKSEEGRPCGLKLLLPHMENNERHISYKFSL